MLDKPI